MLVPVHGNHGARLVDGRARGPDVRAVAVDEIEAFEAVPREYFHYQYEAKAASPSNA